MLLFIDDLVKDMHKGCQTNVAILDFSKAFEVIPHERLIGKLQHYGIRGTTQQWIRSFLTDRTQRVVVENEKSAPAPVTSGVPQGSVLGPILFLVFINDMPESIASHCRLFADDSILYRKVANKDDCKALQDDLEALQEW